MAILITDFRNAISDGGINQPVPELLKGAAKIPGVQVLGR